MKFFKTPLEKEWKKLEKQEYAFIDAAMHKDPSKLNQLLEDKVPTGLQNTLEGAFVKSFQIVFENGTGVIEKSYKKDQIEMTYQMNAYAAKRKENRKNLKSFSQKANRSGHTNLLLSGVSGIGMGVLGIGIPDIVVFTGLMFRSVYEIGLHYGFDYDTVEEKQFILLLIRGAVSHDMDILRINAELNDYIKTGTYTNDIDMSQSIQKTAIALSREILYMKFLQGIPIIGAVGGAYDMVYMKRVNQFAELKYRRRLLESKKKKEI